MIQNESKTVHEDKSQTFPQDRKKYKVLRNNGFRDPKACGVPFSSRGDERVSVRVSVRGMSGARFPCRQFSSQPYFRAGNFQFNPIFVQVVFKSALCW